MSRAKILCVRKAGTVNREMASGGSIVERSKILRHIVGYSIGITLFGIIIPFLLIRFSQHGAPFKETGILSPGWLRITITVTLLAIGLVFVLWSNAALFLIGKRGPTDGFNVGVSPITEKLVVTGPYRYTRNPMVFGANMSYFFHRPVF